MITTSFPGSLIKMRDPGNEVEMISDWWVFRVKNTVFKILRWEMSCIAASQLLQKGEIFSLDSCCSKHLRAWGTDKHLLIAQMRTRQARGMLFFSWYQWKAQQQQREFGWICKKTYLSQLKNKWSTKFERYCSLRSATFRVTGITTKFDCVPWKLTSNIG